ncbi:glycoside hydrolase family 10 protein [Bacteroidota bacterium]
MKKQFTRRDFMKGIGTGVALTAGGMSLSCDVSDKKSEISSNLTPKLQGFIKALWIHIAKSFPNGKQDVPGVLDKWAEAGFNLLIPHVRGATGETLYHATEHPVSNYAKDWDPLAVINEEAKLRGMQVHPWISVFRGGRSAFANAHPELVGKKKEGETGDHFLCAAQDAVQEWAFSFFKEIMDNYDVAGIHHDYVRYDDYLCWCDHCKTVFRRETGIEMDDMERGSEPWTKWMTSRVHHINKFVYRVQIEAKKSGKETSAAVFANYPRCIETVAQDWVNWAHEKWVDYLLPMNYIGDREIFNQRAKQHLESVNNSIPVIEGVANKLPGEPFNNVKFPDELLELSQYVKTLGFQGICYFVSETLSDDDLKLIKTL